MLSAAADAMEEKYVLFPSCNPSLISDQKTSIYIESNRNTINDRPDEGRCR